MAEKRDGLSAWSLVMLALGTVVGGSFFLGSAVAIRAAGPAILLAFAAGGLLVYFILVSLSEMTVANPETTGSFRDYAEASHGPLLGFTVGWVYWAGLSLAMSSEATAASIFIRSWIGGVPLGVIATGIVITVTLLNFVGAELFSKLETSLAGIKLLALVGFIAVALFLIVGLIPGRPAVGLGTLNTETLAPGGLAGLAGSMLIVMFTYAGFEVVGLAAPEARNPLRTIPRAMLFTVLSLVGLYMAVVVVLLPLVPTGVLTQDISPLVMALTARGLGAVAGTFNFIMVTAILSTMLAATFGLGRMLYALALEGHAPAWLKVTGNSPVPLRGILVSGVAMLAGVSLSFLLPKQVYLFLVSSGGFSLLFAYVVIVASHYRFRREHGCPPTGHCQVPGYPYTSWVAFAALIGIMASMPLIPGQAAGLAAGLTLTGFFMLSYYVFKVWVPGFAGKTAPRFAPAENFEIGQETSEELFPPPKDDEDEGPR